MIIATTKLRKIPDSCLNCKFCTNVDITRKASSKRDGYIGTSYMKKKCFITGIEIPYVYYVSKRNWEYTKCKSCPLQEVKEDD